MPKEYLVQVEGEPTPGAVRRLREGVDLEDGPTAPARVAVVAPTLLRIVIHEGRNRQIRRMCEAVGHPVVRLVRTRIGPLADPSLGPGLLPAALVRRGPEPGRGAPLPVGEAAVGRPPAGARLGPATGLSNMPG